MCVPKPHSQPINNKIRNVPLNLHTQTKALIIAKLLNIGTDRSDKIVIISLSVEDVDRLNGV